MKQIYKLLSITAIVASLVLLSTNLFASDTAKLTVDGMTCNGCVKTVKQALEKVDGVESANVDLNSNSAVVAYNPEKTNLKTMEKAVSDAGYSAKPMTEENSQKPVMKAKSQQKETMDSNHSD